MGKKIIVIEDDNSGCGVLVAIGILLALVIGWIS